MFRRIFLFSVLLKLNAVAKQNIALSAASYLGAQPAVPRLNDASDPPRRESGLTGYANFF